MTPPFIYPFTCHLRRHGPRGYADYSSYRPWLRDEFCFRCVYCLIRERWVLGGFHIDHFCPSKLNPELTAEYDNLLYCCSSCNAAKRELQVPDPTLNLTAESVWILEDGTIESSTQAASRLVRLLGLNSPKYREYRLLWIEILSLARKYQPELYQLLLSYPDDLPDLSSLQPPDGNSRAEGVQASHFERRKNGTLPGIY